MTTKTDINLPPLPVGFFKHRIAGFDGPVYAEMQMEAYARAAVQANSLSADDLADIDDALANLIQDKRDYCPHEDGTAEHVARLEALRQRLTHGGNCAAVEADRQDQFRDATKMVDQSGAVNEMVPSDEELIETWNAALGRPMGNFVSAARAILSRYSSGQPAASAVPRPDEYDYFVDWYDKEAPDESEVRNFDMARHAWLSGLRFADLFPHAAPVAQEPVAWVRPDLVVNGKIQASSFTAHTNYRDGYVPLSLAAPVAAQAQPSGNAGELDERSAFEVWYSEEYFTTPKLKSHAIFRDAVGGYVDVDAHYSWAAWQARAALAQPSAQDWEDVQRYRWLRQQQARSGVGRSGEASVHAVMEGWAADLSPSGTARGGNFWSEKWISGDDLDAAIDAARAAKGVDHD